MAEQLPVLYKIMTLYALSRVEFALTGRQISNVFLDLGYTNYFNVQYNLGELVESGLVKEDSYPDCSYYSLSEEGAKTAEALTMDLSEAIRSDIDSYLKQNRLEFREAVSTRANYYRTDSGDFGVRCQTLDHGTAIIDLTITVPNEVQAKIVCRGWKEKYGDIYQYIIKALAAGSES